MPEDAPPVATERDEDISRIVGGTEATELKNAGIWSSSRQYQAGEYVSMQKGGYNYYFVAKTTIPSGQGTKFAPPNPDYWVADMCSKSLTGCRKRWGTKGSVVIGETKDFVKGELQYGGFPNATRLDQTN